MRLLTVKEAAQEIGVSVPHMHRLVKNIPAHANPNGRGNVYLPSDVELLKARSKSKVVTPQLSFSEIGSASIRRDGSTITEERLHQLRGSQGRILLHEMRVNDPVINACFLAMENCLRRVTMRVSPRSESPADKEVAEFVEQCLHDMSFSWDATMQYILSMLEYGFSVQETVYKKRSGNNAEVASEYNDGKIGWRKWALRPAESLTPGQEWIFDENGGIQGARQTPLDYTKGMIEIPIEKLLIFRTSVMSPEGIPVHRSAYLPWWLSQNLQEIEGIGIERDLAGIPVVYMGRDTKKTGANNDFDQSKDIVVNLRNDEQSGVVFPYPKLGTAGEGEGILLELLSTAGRRSYNTSGIIDRYNKQKAMSMLSQFIVLGMDAVGSFALGRLQADIFSLAVSAWATSIVEVINRHAIPRLIKYNSFPGMTKMPKLVPSDVGIPDLEQIAYFINYLVQNQLLDPRDKEVQRYLRQVAHLPPLSEFVEEEEEQGKNVNIRDPKFLRTSRASLIMTRIQKLMEEGLISPEEGEAFLADLREELRESLGIPSEGVAKPRDVKPRAGRADEVVSRMSRKLDDLEEKRVKEEDEDD